MMVGVSPVANQVSVTGVGLSASLGLLHTLTGKRQPPVKAM